MLKYLHKKLLPKKHSRPLETSLAHPCLELHNGSLWKLGKSSNLKTALLEFAKCKICQLKIKNNKLII